MNGIQVEYKDFMIQPSDSTAAGKKKKKVSLSMDTKCYPEELPPSPPPFGHTRANCGVSCRGNVRHVSGVSKE